MSGKKRLDITTEQVGYNYSTWVKSSGSPANSDVRYGLALHAVQALVQAVADDLGITQLETIDRLRKDSIDKFIGGDTDA